MALLYAEKTPPALVARAIPDLARLGFLPPNDLGSFMENAAPEVRASAILSLNVKKALPQDLQQSVMDHIADPDESVRQAAMLALVPLQLRAAVPQLLELAARPTAADYATAVEALCGLRDPRAASVYLAALEDSNPRLRKLAESALLSIHDKLPAEFISTARSTRLSTRAALVLDRLQARFTPVASWLVLGPFRASLRASSSASARSTSRRRARARPAARSPGLIDVATLRPVALTFKISRASKVSPICRQPARMAPLASALLPTLKSTSSAPLPPL